MSTKICDVWLGKLFGPVLTLVHFRHSLNLSQSRNEWYFVCFYFLCIYCFVSEEESGGNNEQTRNRQLNVCCGTR